MDFRWLDGRSQYRLVDPYVCDNRTQVYSKISRKVKVGARVKFNAFSELGLSNAFLATEGDEVTGTIVYINHEHKWFTVEYGENPILRTGFNFSDIGDTVYVL